jgi:sigma-E factor negative regulatory protein RseB
MALRPLGSSLWLAALLLPFSVAAEQADPGQWLDRMAVAVQSVNYEGTVLRIQDGRAAALKVVHRVVDGVIQEKVVAQEGNSIEIVRNGNEVHCILPDRQSVVVEQWDDRSTLFSTLPTSNVSFGNEYDLAIIREERVAGRPAMLLAIRPHDAYRYGHKIWLDKETAFPLQTQVIDAEGEVVEQVKFAEISLNQDIQASALAPSVDTQNFRWLNQSSRHVSHKIETSWSSDELPTGFRVVSTHGEMMPGTEEVVTHILYSDGLANVSVFIAPQGDNSAEGDSRVGGSNSYTAIVGDHRVTAVGEVPKITVRQFATTMAPR